MKKINLKAEKRSVLGRKVKKLRREGKTPGVVYGKNVKSEAVSFDTKEFKDVYKSAGETNIVELLAGKNEYPVLIHDVQFHPVSDEILHVDFLKVNLKEKITANVPVETVGEPPAEKQGIGAMVVHLDEIDVECLPGDIPDSFEVNVEKLAEVDDMIQIKDLKVDSSKVKITNDPEEIVVKIDPLTKVEEVSVPAVEAGEGEEGETSTGEEESSEDEEKFPENKTEEK